ncbi:MAG: (d)CMP kinase [Chloroflexi bacterium]|nr:(d)CMP kinase [Chloroflexota bacterium]
MKLPSVIAIDGPAAAGKTTLAMRLADHLDYLYFDTGVMYRAATLAALRRDLDIDDETTIVDLVFTLDIDVRSPDSDSDGPMVVLLDGEDVSAELRSREVDQNVSKTAAYQQVRAQMVDRQRIIGLRSPVVMVGRDIGTVVLPDADLKLYVVASVEERARRRHTELLRKGRSDSYESVLEAMIRRDKIDAEREHGPMRAAENARVVDTTGLSADQVFEIAVQHVMDASQPEVENGS